MCALRFVVDKAKDMGVDTDRIVVSGESAGGRLALAVGIIPESAGFTRLCAGGVFRSVATTVPKAAAIINWYGITDVGEMLAGPNLEITPFNGSDRSATGKRLRAACPR